MASRAGSSGITALLAAAIVVAGCYPLELSVSSGGEIAIARAEGIVVYNPKTGEGTMIPRGHQADAPAFAVISPDGTKVLHSCLEIDEKGNTGSQSRIMLSLVKPGSDAEGAEETGEMAVVENGCFLQWAPDAKVFSYGYVSGQTYDGIEENLPEIKIMNPADKSERLVSRNTSLMHRWTPDGKGIVFLKTEAKDTDGRLGSIALFNTANGKIRKIARILDAEWFDLSPDGKEIILAAAAMAEPGKTPVKEEYADKVMYLVTVADGTFKRLDGNANFARYSPDGNHIALLADNAIWITGRDGVKPEKPLMRAVMEFDNAKFHPTWISSTEILSIVKRAVFGAVAHSCELQAGNIETGEVRSLQDGIEECVRKAKTK